MGKANFVSPFAPQSLPDVPIVDGVRFATAEAGIRYKGRTDLLLALLAPGTTVAGVLTRSKTRSAPVEWCAKGIERGEARALVVNSGNANAFTGKKGREAVAITAERAARAAGCTPADVLRRLDRRHRRAARSDKFAHLLAKLAADAVPTAGTRPRARS